MPDDANETIQGDAPLRAPASPAVSESGQEVAESFDARVQVVWAWRAREQGRASRIAEKVH